MAKISRGDVVVARVSERGKSKVRPLLVVQNDRNNARLTNLIVAMVTSTTQRAGKEATQVLVETVTVYEPVCELPRLRRSRSGYWFVGLWHQRW